MAFNEPPTLDDFNRTDASDLGSNWTADISAGGFASIGIVGNEATYDGVGTQFQSNWYNLARYAHDQSVKATCVTKGSTNPMRLYLGILNPGSSLYSGYEVEIAGANTYISRVAGGTRTTLVNTFTTINAGEPVGFQRVGSALEVYQDSGSGWTLNGSTTDSQVVGSGFAGLWIQNDADATWDDFGAMTINADVPFVLPHRVVG